MTPDPCAYALMHDGSTALAQVEANGMRLDLEQLDATLSWAQKQITKREMRLKDSAEWEVWQKRFGRTANIDSDAQLAVVLFEELGHTPLEFGKTRAKTDETALEKLNIPFLIDYLQVKKLKKLEGTYLRGIKAEAVHGIVHPSFNLHFVRTYRSSCSSPNLQNVPIRNPMIGGAIRSCFIPRDGHVIIEVDISGAEVRGAGWYTKDPMLLKYIADKSTDMHRDMSAECFLMKPREVTKAIRSQVKGIFVFAEFYGDFYAPVARSLWDAIDRFKLTGPDGKSLYEHLASKGIARLGACDPRKDPKPGTFEKHIREVESRFWNERFHAYNKWKKDTYNLYLRQGYLKTLTGFCLSGVFTRNEILNAPIQGTAFHCLLWSLIQLNKWLTKNKMKSKIVCQIHDSMVLDVHVDEIDRVLKKAKQIMTEEIRDHWKWICTDLEIEAEGCQLGETWHDKKPLAI